MKIAFALSCLVLLISVIQAKHLHPRSLVKVGEINVDNQNEEPRDVIRDVKPNRFVPINSVFYFTSYPPCEDGLERDLLGICREVWD